MTIDLGAREIIEEPFPSFRCESVLPPGVESSLLDWFKGDAPWQLKVADFYQQYEFSLHDISVPEPVEFLLADQQIDYFKRCLGESFGVSFQSRFDATVHKLVPGQVIKIHNDFVPGLETHRILIQVNEGWSVDSGGLLMLFSSFDPKDVSMILLPVSGSAFGFEISEKSLHAVTPIVSGDRFTIVYSFYCDRSY